MSVTDALFVGIDTLRILGRVSPATQSAAQALRMPTRIDITTVGKPAKGSEGNVTASTKWVDGVPHLTLEASLPKIGAGHNTYALPVTALRETVERMHAVTYGGVRFADAPERLMVMRLDIVRDFKDVVDGSAHLDGLARVGAQRARTMLYAGPHGEAQTVVRETTRWRTQLYLREACVRDTMQGHEELPHLLHLNEGRLRYELQLKSPELRKAGVRTVRDIASLGTLELARERFRRSRFDFPIGDPLAAFRRAYRELSAGKTLRGARAVFGQLVCDAIAAGDFHRGQAVEYRERARKAGLHPADLFQGWPRIVGALTSSGDCWSRWRADDGRAEHRVIHPGVCVQALACDA